MPDPSSHADLEALLRKRLSVIADHSLRDRDSTAHLEALQQVSLEITAAGESLPGLPPRLRHFLERCSFDKALAFLEETQGAE